MKLMHRIGKIELPIRVLQELKVGVIYLFGSEAEETNTPLSDVDLGIVFAEPIADALEAHNRLYGALADLVPDREIDLALLHQAPLPVRFEAVTRGKVLYRTSAEFEADYRERIVKEYIDFKPLLEESAHVILEAFT